MKFSVKLIAAALCAAMLCVPALAAASAPARGPTSRTLNIP